MEKTELKGKVMIQSNISDNNKKHEDALKAVENFKNKGGKVHVMNLFTHRPSWTVHKHKTSDGTTSKMIEG